MKPLDIFCLTVKVRLCVLVFCALCDCFLDDYDTSTTALHGKPLFGFPHHWDSVFFEDVAVNQGTYRFIHYHAFMPLFPLVLRGLLKYSAILGVLLWNMGCYAVAAISLQSLTRTLHGPSSSEDHFAYVAMVLFIVSPSGVFTSAFYCDATFAALSTLGMASLAKGYTRISIVAFTLATCTRSNGILNAGFLLYTALFLPERTALGRLHDLVGVIVITSPFFIYQYWAFYSANCDTLPMSLIEECKGPFYGFYSRIQRVHWGVGWLMQYEWKNLPNFFIAIPTIAVACRGVWDQRRVGGLELRLWPPQWSRARHLVRAHYLYMMCMVFIALLQMHVQVMARFMFSCPALYWSAAKVAQSTARSRRLLVAYIVVWNIAGCVMFSNFYPWT